MRAISWRLPVIVNTALIAILFVGGSALFAYVFQTARTNADFICAFGKALNQSRIEQRAEESVAQFRKRVATSREFVHELNRLQDCDPRAVIRIKPDSRELLKKKTVRNGGTNLDRPAEQTGGGTQSSAPPSQQPGPPSGGPPRNPPGNGNPPDRGLLDEVVDETCDLTSTPILC